MSEVKKDESDLSALLVADAKIRGTSPYSYRAGEWALITGVKVCTPEGLGSRVAFECKYADGFVDYIPVRDESSYELGS